ncbi:hypothetical protein SAMN05444414_1189 [Roseovarius marisflavi]|uniref:Uncharacterized protein n=1 Tax=Roseovarius marisflavi TaxID=1054996 RepID=A0A1M7BFZ4_9RHOB|nr:hypothetical protein SAMN05444414_1189 [Roseovarius marisflavi]
MTSHDARAIGGCKTVNSAARGLDTAMRLVSLTDHLSHVSPDKGVSGALNPLTQGRVLLPSEGRVKREAAP